MTTEQKNGFQGVRIYDSPALILGATAKGSAQMHGLVRFFINSAELSDFYVFVPVERFLRECHHGRWSDNRPRGGAAKKVVKVAKIFEMLELFKDAQNF